MNQTLFAAFDLQGDEVMAMVLGFAFLLIPIVAILTRHQQKMAELVHKRGEAQDPQVQALSAQVERLTQALHAQTLAVDELSRKLDPTPQQPPAFEQSPRNYINR